MLFKSLLVKYFKNRVQNYVLPCVGVYTHEIPLKYIEVCSFSLSKYVKGLRVLKLLQLTTEDYFYYLTSLLMVH